MKLKKVTIVNESDFLQKFVSIRHTEGNATKRITCVRTPIGFFIPSSLYTATKLQDKLL